MNRKEFLKSSAVLGAGLGLLPSTRLPAMAAERIPRIGLGLFSVPKFLERDLEGGIATMARIGIRAFETYGPYPFSDARNKASWAAITAQLGFEASGFFGRTAEAFRDLLAPHGITVPSMHTDLYTLESNMKALATAARTLGAEYVVLPAIPEEERQDRAAYHRMAGRFNEIGRQAREEGIRFAYHNHGYGLVPEADGTVPLEIILSNTDPDTVFLEMDLFWTVAGKADPQALLLAHPGRYRMLHIKDMKTITHFEGKGSTPMEWMALFPLLVAAGEGAIPLADILRTAYQAGVAHYFIEHDFAPDPEQNIRSAHDFLASLQL